MRNVREFAILMTVPRCATNCRLNSSGYRPDYQHGDKPEPLPFDLSAGPPAVKAGESFGVRVGLAGATANRHRPGAQRTEHYHPGSPTRLGHQPALSER